ncbi:MAG: SDR family NAD(P)-dependent oxidoreductase [Spirochaetia bacterium]|nr:SDR family NAD(P)-dependent oxidoreductase [Spirochaetia bacterium]
MKNYKKIFITGASSGLGHALAKEYAKEGVILGLASRRLDILKKIQKELEKTKANVFIYKTDVSKISEVKKAAFDFIKKARGVDLVIANAGIGSKYHKLHYTPEEIAEIFNTNTIGVTNTISVFLNEMIISKKGHCAAIGSVAGFRPLPDSGYSASKSAVHFFMNSLRLRYNNFGIKFTNIAPGFIDTPFVKKHKFQMPFIMSAEKAAKIIVRAIRKNKKNYIFPWQMRLLMPVIKRLPDFLIRAGMKGKIEMP